MFVSISILFVFSFILNASSLFKAKRPVLIAIDQNGTRIVTEEKDPIFKTEAVAFIQRFLRSVYNFKSDSFVRNIGYATNVMSEDLWEAKKNEIIDLKNRVDRDQVSVNGIIQKLSLDENGIYYALIDVKEYSRLSERNHRVKVAIKLKQSLRTLENPTGLMVDSYEEELINN
jgi:hypothetical protein